MSRLECSECGGDGEVGPTGESAVAELVVRKERIRLLYLAAWKALEIVRGYLTSPDFGSPGFAVTTAFGFGRFSDQRIRQCLNQVRSYRFLIRAIRLQRRPKQGELAWCIACRGAGFADGTCEGCGNPVTLDTVHLDALDEADILVHRGCDVDRRYSDHERAPPRGENYFGSADARGWR